ncbi:MAG TPA: FlgD immunoglobulin-like domain containing protein [Candidatus Eisenbacteria bacterium]|nr:FlgD immunoglobulin-like domain containing protein [Candidatus Eisenbacteria bacterium]
MTQVPPMRAVTRARSVLVLALLLLGSAAAASHALAFDWIPPRPVTAILPGATLARSSPQIIPLTIFASGAPASLIWSAASSGEFAAGVSPSSGSINVPAGAVGTVNLTVTVPDTALGICVLHVVLVHTVGGSQAGKASAIITAATDGRPEVKPVLFAAPAGVAGNVSFQVHSLSGSSEQVALTTGRINPDPNNDGSLFPGSPPPSLVTLPAGGTITVSESMTIASNAFAGNVNAVQLSVTSVGGISNAVGYALSTASGAVPTALVPAGVLRGDDVVVGRDGAAYLASHGEWLVATGLTGVRVVRDVSTDSIGPVDAGGDGSDDRWLGTIRIPSYAASIAIVPRFARSPGDTIDVGLCAAGRGGLMLLDLTVTDDPTFGTWEDFFDVDLNGIDDRILRIIPTSGFATDAGWFRAPSGRVVAMVAAADTGSVPVSASYNPASVVAGTGQGIVAIDLGAALDPGLPPYAAGTLATPGSALDLELRGGTSPDLAIADGTGGVAVYSLTASGGNPAAVTFTPRGTVGLSSAWGTPYARDLAWVSNTKDSIYVAVAASAGGLQLVRAPRGGAPQLVLAQQTLAPAIGVGGTWTGTLAAAMGASGIALLRAPGGGYLDRIVTGAPSPYTPPVTLARLATWSATGQALEVALHQTPMSAIGAAVFKPTTGPLPTLLASDGNRLLSLRPGNAAITAVEIDPVSPPSEPFLAVSPNPAPGRVRIEVRGGWGDVAFSSDGYGPSVGRFAIEVFDVAGRRVRRLEGDGGAATSTSIEWDGRDASGRPVASGRYWLRPVSRGDRTELAVPVILLR